MSYKELIAYIASELAPFFEWNKQEGNPEKNLYPVFGIPRSTHIYYLEDESRVPGDISAHIETLSLLDKCSLIHLALRRIKPDGFTKLDIASASPLIQRTWEEASGYKINNMSSSISTRWIPNQESNKLRKSLKIDPSGSSVVLKIDKLIPKLQSYLTDNKSSDKQLAALGKLKWFFSTPTYTDFKNNQSEMIRERVERYKSNLTQEDVEWIQSLPVGVLETANENFKRFKKVSAFEGQKLDTAPTYSKVIFQFNTVEDLVASMTRIPNGFAMCAIKNSNPIDSYFVIAIKNGENLVLLSDSPKYSSPLQAERMNARNSRYAEDRHNDSYLPYELFNIIWFDNGRRTEESSESTALVDPKTNLTIIGTIDNLSIGQILWFSEIVELAYDAFFTQEYTLEPIGITSKDNLLLPSESKNKEQGTSLIANSTAPIIKGSTSRQLTRDKLDSQFPELAKKNHPNKWMQKKYAGQVSDDILYLAEEPEQPLLLAAPSTKNEKINATELVAQNTALKVMSKGTLMTAGEAQSTADFLARVNQTKAIQAIANAEYVKNKDKLEKWVYKKITENMPNLIDDLVSLNHEKFAIAPLMKQEQYEGHGLTTYQLRQVHIGYADFATRYVKKKNELTPLAKALNLFQAGVPYSLCYLCKHYGEEFPLLEPDDCEHRIYLEVSNVFDLINLTGVARKDMPIELQYYGLKPRLGNTILDIHDPLDELENPYNKLVFRFALPLNFDALNARRKKLGLKRLYKTNLPKNYWDKDCPREELDVLIEASSFKGTYTTNTPSFKFHIK